MFIVDLSFIKKFVPSFFSLLLWVQSSIGSSSAMYHPRWSPYRDMMPTYNQLAASSLLNQQYSAALGLGTEILEL